MGILETVDLTQELTKKEYQERLLAAQLELRGLAFQLYEQKRSLVLVYEGWDAGGKGGSIRRITERLDPRGYQVYAIAAPRGDDQTHHYLWRFWRRLKAPDDKQLIVFDRSWYGRVLVERIEGFATEREWKRAYREINDFERQLADHGVLVGKFWFHISRDEQLARFEARKTTPHKRWKLTDEDYRNREKWDLYEAAVNDMLLKTSTRTAPWTLIAANNKYFARVQSIEQTVKLLKSDPELAAGAKKKRKASKIDDD